LDDKHKRGSPAIQSEAVDDDGNGFDQTGVAVEVIREFDAMIKNLKNRIEKEVPLMENESGRERSARMEAIKGMR
jgi:hypothetical protein